MPSSARTTPARPVDRIRHPFPARGIPPTGLAILAIGAVQLGAALAKGLIATVGPAGTVLLRAGFAAAALLVVGRPRLRGHARGDYLLALLFGLTLAGMNLAFYSAIGRIPLGVAVTLEFVGPLGVAVAGSRRPLDLLWVGAAAVGILLLAPLGEGRTSAPGVALALTAGALWAAYILLSARVGRAFPDGAGLTLALCVATVVLLPVGAWRGGAALLSPATLAAGLGVALLSSAIPYSLELEALRRLPTRVFGVLMSLEPAIAALVGFALLREALGPRALVAIALVTLASVGASRAGGGEAGV